MKPNYYYNYNDNSIQKMIKPFIEKKLNKIDLAIEIYIFVRDNWKYSPTRFSLIKDDWKASNLIKSTKGHCIDKSVILITLLQAVDIPARLGLAKVKNHIAVDKIIELLETDVLVPHGYVEIFLNNKWVKATPAFNKSLCEKLGVEVLEFNGKEDSIFQKYSKNNSQFMEYIEEYGHFESIPFDFMKELLFTNYPILKKLGLKDGSVVDFESFEK